MFARELCINEVQDPESLEALMACCLTPLDKNAGLRPIGIGETLRRILGKAVMSVLKEDVQIRETYSCVEDMQVV